VQRRSRVLLLCVADQHVTPEFSKALQQARQAKGMTQKDLAAKIAQKPTVIQEYESGTCHRSYPSRLCVGRSDGRACCLARAAGAGKAIPSQQIIQSLSRVLGVKLPKIPKAKPVAAKDDD
jgi:ribosome-binding protein aMBF1 (putative translation factor)